MTNKNTEKDWDKLKPYIKNISIGQYDDNGVNIGSVKADEMIWKFIQQKIKEAYRRGYARGYVDGESDGLKTTK